MAAKNEVIANVSGDKLMRIVAEMHLLHMNDATVAMLKERYPEVYRRLVSAQLDDAERRLINLLKD
jgi:hypothetical protein